MSVRTDMLVSEIPAPKATSAAAKPSRLRVMLDRAAENRRLRRDNREFEAALAHASPSMRTELLAAARRVDY